MSSLNNRRWRMLQCGGAILGAAALLVGCGSIPQLSDATDNLEDRIAEAWNNSEETDAEHEALSSEAAPEPDPIDINVAPLPPGTALDISAHEPTPGSSFNFQICTAAWSFQLEDGRTIAVTASHCAQEGETVWAGNQDGRFEYPSEPIGKVIYSDLYAEDSHGLDVAFVELYRDDAYYTPRWMETTVDASGALPDDVCKFGRVTGETCGALTSEAMTARLHAGDQEIEAFGARAEVCGTRGDSGGAVFANIDGRDTIVGLVSGTTELLDEGQTCADHPGMEMSFTVASDVLAIIPVVLGSNVAQS
ncbi:MAG: trypsin-like serine protease [Corynebacterium camporealensis]|uniref:trypsin-like serine protease n=1 Tax=Corynebacterium camporealensis TaxID=161896 RepID=UPI002A90BE75|nr:trypsin-like serine protease [Corynebacterium camporealensis]MDY5840610.1 trypsin-like serine protease [Corynebacterium camporealensis]